MASQKGSGQQSRKSHGGPRTSPPARFSRKTKNVTKGPQDLDKFKNQSSR